MSDQTVIVRNQGRIFLAGPPLVKAATGEVVDEETLGGGEMHARESGVVDYLVSSDEEGIARGREIVADLGAPFPSTSASEVSFRFTALFIRSANTQSMTKSVLHKIVTKLCLTRPLCSSGGLSDSLGTTSSRSAALSSP